MALSFADTAYAIRFLRLLTMPFTKTAAFKTGVIDRNGKKLPKPSTGYSPQQKAAYTIFHRLVFNIRRILLKVPVIKGTIANYLTALFLIKEHTKLTDLELGEILNEVYGINPNEENFISESNLFINKKEHLIKGVYTLNKELLLPTTAEPLIKKNSEVIVSEDSKPVGRIFNVPVFKVKHVNTKNYIYVTEEDIDNAK